VGLRAGRGVRVGGVTFGRKGRARGEEGAHALDGGDEGCMRGDVDCFLGGGVRGRDGGVEEGAFG
jgi:hypothetical protein